MGKDGRPRLISFSFVNESKFTKKTIIYLVPIPLVTSLLSQVNERLLTHPQPYKSRLPFAAEADMINKIVFGNTSKEWRLHNTDKPTSRNQRDYASVLDLTVLNNLEFLDAMLIQWDVVELEERRKILRTTYDFIYPILQRSKTIKELQKLADKALK